MKIDIVPYCGLGNRINVLSCAIAFQRATKQNVTVFWEKTDDCYAWFDELFLPIDGLRVERLKNFYMKSPGKAELWIPRLLRKFVYDKTFKARKLIENTNFADECSGEGKMFIEGNRPFCQHVETSMLSNYYRPVPQIQQAIDVFTSQYAPFTIGVHVRRTDHRDVIAHNPLEGYVKAMRQQLTEHPDAMFYIASDDENVKQYMCDNFPNRIITNSIALVRNSVQGMQDAVVELYCLGMTNLIIGSKGSTYSELAAKLFDSPIIYPL